MKSNRQRRPGLSASLATSFAAAALVVTAAGCETPTHTSVRIYEYQREVPLEDQANKKRDSDAKMVSPGRMVSPGSMVDDR